MNTPQLRTAVTADISAITDLVVTAYRGETGAGGGLREIDVLTDDRITEPEVAAEIADDRTRILVAEQDGRIVGCASLYRKSPERAYYGMFAVDPAAQGQGLGRSVLAEAERVAATEWGASELEISVVEVRTGLREYYERRGFAHTGDRELIPTTLARAPRWADDDLYWVSMLKPLG